MIEMAMIVQLVLSLQVVSVVDVSVIVLLAGEDSSTIADDVMTGDVNHRMMLFYPHHRRHRNNQLRTIST